MRTARPRRIMLLTLWILICATPALAADDEGHSGYTETPLDPHDADHWAFQPVADVEVPAVDSGWSRTPIDHFVEHSLAVDGLSPQTAADRQTLIRRLSFDLTGLPPTPHQISEFVQDSRSDAWTRLVDRLLASPHFGERQAQHWLDLARFAETDGFEHDKVRSDAWRYRDWVIDAFNADMPYDEFVLRQLAGDEAFPGDDSARTATGFCLSGPDMPDINLLSERRHSVLNELTSTVGEVFLGLQIGCAQCHDHKYDPVSQADFYRLRAVFAPAVSLQKNRSLTTLHESFPSAEPAHLMLRGDFRRPGPEVTPDVPRVVSAVSNPFAPVRSDSTAGLRTALAKWLTSKHNPLTARVIVNRVWQSHFGTGLVDTPSEFGLMGSEPSHPQLLDWLARSLISDGWSLKRLHRRIVLSAVYRQRSRLATLASEEQRAAWKRSLQRDPNAYGLSRFPRRRLDGEAIRDAMLLASGRINRQAKGPGVRPPLPDELIKTLLRNQWKVTEDRQQHDRRSIYVFARRNLRYPIFEVFDRPSANASCAVRGRSTTAPQSLHLLNSRFSLQMAESLAKRLVAEQEERPQQIAAAFRHCLAREPNADERNDAERFIQNSSGSDEERLTHLCLSLFNCNEFVFVD
ncbi:MAG: DUF1549 and DUF1553 domain-containing protein [Planctomycetaceae bacterium]|nr:DUF1549 and DUF1553 domain-containing protein [Planctomycetaceae bacterium]